MNRCHACKHRTSAFALPCLCIPHFFSSFFLEESIYTIRECMSSNNVRNHIYTYIFMSNCRLTSLLVNISDAVQQLIYYSTLLINTERRDLNWRAKLMEAFNISTSGPDREIARLITSLTWPSCQSPLLPCIISSSSYTLILVDLMQTSIYRPHAVNKMTTCIVRN